MQCQFNVGPEVALSPRILLQVPKLTHWPYTDITTDRLLPRHHASNFRHNLIDNENRTDPSPEGLETVDLALILTQLFETLKYTLFLKVSKVHFYARTLIYFPFSHIFIHFFSFLVTTLSFFFHLQYFFIFFIHNFFFHSFFVIHNILFSFYIPSSFFHCLFFIHNIFSPSYFNHSFYLQSYLSLFFYFVHNIFHSF